MARDVVCIGEALIDFVPTEPDVALTDALSFRKAADGAPANVAVGLARLGVSTSFIGMVGDDPFGEYLVKTLAAAGVGVRAVQRTSDSLTSLAFVSPLPDGGGDFVFYRQPGADTLLSTEHVDRDLIADARFVHFGSIGLIDEPSRSATLHAIQCARGSNCRTSCDVKRCTVTGRQDHAETRFDLNESGFGLITDVGTSFRRRRNQVYFNSANRCVSRIPA